MLGKNLQLAGVLQCNVYGKARIIGCWHSGVPKKDKVFEEEYHV